MTKMQRQIEMEADMITGGITRYREQNTKLKSKQKESQTDYGSVLIGAAVDKVAKAITAKMDEALEGKAGRTPRVFRYLSELDPEVCAFLALKAVIDGVQQLRPVQAVAVSIGSLIYEDTVFREMRKQDKKAWDWMAKRLRDSSSGEYQHSKTVMLWLAKQREMDLTSAWPEQDRLVIGTWLIDRVAESTGLIETKSLHLTRNNRTIYLVPTESTVAWIQSKEARSELLMPQFMPTIVPPKDWTGPSDGGYHGPLAGRLTLVKTTNRAYLDELEASEMPVVYQSLNALQQTGWRVNKRVLGVMQEAYNAGIKLEAMPTSELRELPQRPEDIETNEEARKEYRIQAKHVHIHNHRVIGKVLQYVRTMKLAEELLEEDEFFYPYQLDFRGRAYPVPAHLQPQGADAAKGLLEFSEGKPLGEEGAVWLALQLSGSYGFDKATLQERVDWVFDNQDAILMSAASPLDCHWWLKGDKPWQVLAACFEWERYCIEGPDAVSHIPCAMDGSCNGLQHYGAMLRDSWGGGAAVNLVPSDKPEDIYRKVLEATEKELMEVATGDDPERALLAQEILSSGQLDRKLVKRPVMTMPYGSKRFGIRDQMLQELQQRAHKEPVALENLWDTSNLLADVVWEAIGTVVVAARQAMNWLQEVASLVSKEDLPIYWVTPVGLPVRQEYRTFKQREVRTMLSGKTVKLGLREQTDKLDRKKQSNGIAPNFIHSQDAAAMMLTVVGAMEQGVTHFAMVHDSYGCHACDAPYLAYSTREEFVSLYESADWLEVFEEEIRRQLSEESRDKIPARPVPGDLDLKGIMESDFFFA